MTQAHARQTQTNSAAEPIPPQTTNTSATSILELDPDAVIVDPDLSGLRDPGGVEYNLANLQRSIQSEGQLEPGIVRETEEGYVLVAGHRRLAAIKAARAEGDDSLLFRAVVEKVTSPEQAFRLALHENIHRENFTPLEFARAVRSARDKFGWQGKPGTVKVADFLEVSPATVTQAERALGLPADVKGELARGAISLSTALEYANVKEEKTEEVRAKAQEKADAEAKVKEEKKAKEKPAVPLSEGLRVLKQKHKERLEAEKKAKAEGKQAADKTEEKADIPDLEFPEPAQELEPDQPAEPAEPAKPAAPAKVQAKHVRAAAKEVGAQKKILAPRIWEVVEKLRLWSGPAFPKPMTAFADGFVLWIGGELTEAKLDALWDDIADLIPVGHFIPAQAKVKKDAKPAAKKVSKPVSKSAKSAGKPVSKSSAKQKSKAKTAKKAAPKKK